MSMNDETVAGLREALRVSPNNLPLRQTLADILMTLGRCGEAEAEYRNALGLSPENLKLKIGLASAFLGQAKHSHALVIVEDLLKLGEAPPKVFILHSRLLLATGDGGRAARQYKKAIEVDASMADAELAARLGVNQMANNPSPRAPEFVRVGDDQRPDVTFADVGGMDAVKEDIRIKIIHPLTHPELYKAYGKSTGGGILMYGPPGCGKTHLARATAGEIRATFMAVGISDVLDMWIGSSERNLHAFFEQARRKKPCVLFFDEVDALAASRSDMRASAGRHLINQFLAEMDGINANNDGVLLLAATNAPWHVDPAFRRPGRFDSILFVPPPDARARAAILRIQLEKKPVAEIDHNVVAARAEGFSGADLKAVVELAVDTKLREAMKSGLPMPISTDDLIDAVAKIKPSTHEWFAAARNYAMYSNQSGTYDDVLKYLKM
jgi:ATP-dependent 26S proteasome regulatory subunit